MAAGFKSLWNFSHPERDYSLSAYVEFVDAFTKTVKKINDAMKQVDLSRVYTRFPLPQLGELTGWEWIYFSAAHSVRHTRQLRKIHEKLQS